MSKRKPPFSFSRVQEFKTHQPEGKLQTSQAPVDSAANTDRTGPAGTDPDNVYWWGD